MLSKNFSHLIGVPYQAMNCWRLAQAFYRDVIGAELMHYYECGAPEERQGVKELIFSNLGDFEKVEGPYQFGDLLLIKILGIESHIAVYVGEGRMLHTSKNQGSNIDRVAKWQKLITSAHRLPA